MISDDEWANYKELVFGANKYLGLIIAKSSPESGLGSGIRLLPMVHNIYNKLDLDISDIVQPQFILYTKLAYLVEIFCANGYTSFNNLDKFKALDILEFMKNTSILMKNILDITGEISKYHGKILSDLTENPERTNQIIIKVIEENLSIVYDNFIKNIMKSGANINNIVEHIQNFATSIFSPDVIAYFLEGVIEEPVCSQNIIVLDIANYCKDYIKQSLI
jgi:hypothetical protein